MEMNVTNKEVIKEQQIFPWFQIFLDKIVRNCLDDCDEDLLHHLLENIDNEIKVISVRHARKRLKALFETVQDLFLHFWWRIRWKKEKMWKKYWKKDYTDVSCYDIRTECVVKLLYFMIYIGILLSKGATDSIWIGHSLQALKFLPDHDNVVYSSLLLVQSLKRRYHPSYCAILKNVLISKATKCIPEPVVYVKILILFRRLKGMLKARDQNAKKELLSAALKFLAPPNLIPWMESLDLDVSEIKNMTAAQYLFDSSFKDLFQKLKVIVGEYEFLPTEKASKERKNKVANLGSLLDLDSTLNFFHSPGNLEVLKKENLIITSVKKEIKVRKKKERKPTTKINSEKEISECSAIGNSNQESLLNLDSTLNFFHSPENLKVLEKEVLRIPSDKKESKLRKKKKGKHKTKINSEKKGTECSAISDKTHLESFHNKEDNEAVGLSYAPTSMYINKSTINLDETHSMSFKNGENNETCNLRFSPSLLVSISETAANSNKIDSVSFNREKDNNGYGFCCTSSSLMNTNGTALTLAETHPDSFNNEHGNGTVNVGNIQSSPTCINDTVLNLDDISSRSRHVNLTLQPSSPKQNPLLFSPESQLKSSDHQIPLVPKKNKESIKLNTTVEKPSKRKTLSKKLSLCKYKKKPLKPSCKKFKLFNADLFESSRKLIDTQTNINALCDANKSAESIPSSISANVSLDHNMDMLQNSSKKKPILPSVQVNRSSCLSVCEESSLKVATKKQVYSHSADDEMYNTQSLSIFDSVPVSMADAGNSHHANTDNSTPVYFDVNHPNTVNSLRTPLLQKENYVLNDACEVSPSEAIIANDETADNVANQPIHLQHTNLVNPDSQFPHCYSNTNLIQDDSKTRHEHLSSLSSGEILEQLCNNFNSSENLNSNNNSSSFPLNECHPNHPRTCSVNENMEYSRNQNFNQTGNGKNTIEVCTNGLVFPQNKSICTTSDGNTSFVVDCNFVNHNQPNTEYKSKNTDIPSIKIIINLNKKQDNSMHQSNEPGASNIELAATPLVGNVPSNIFSDSFNLSERNALPDTTLSSMLHCNNNSHHLIHNSHKETHTQIQMKVPRNLSSSTPCQGYQKTSPFFSFNKSHSEANDFSALTVSQRRASTDTSGFYTPHTSDCETDGPVQEETSPGNVSSLQKRYIERYVQSVSNSAKVNLTPAFTSLQHHQIQCSSASGSRQHQVNNVTSSQASPLARTQPRKSACDIYSDASNDDTSVSSLEIIFHEGNKRNSTPDDSCHKTKKVQFSSLNSGETSTNKKALNSEHETSKPTPRKRKIHNPIPHRYHLRSRKQMKRPFYMTNYSTE